MAETKTPVNKALFFCTPIHLYVHRLNWRLKKILVSFFMHIANTEKSKTQPQKCLLLQDYKHHVTNTNNLTMFDSIFQIKIYLNLKY